MTDPNLLSYIQKSRAEGMSDDFIRASLLGAGWNANAVDLTFDELSKKSLSAFAKESSIAEENNQQTFSSENNFANTSDNKQTLVMGISALVIFLLGSGVAIAGWFFYSKPPPKTEKKGIESVADNFIPALPALDEANAKSRDAQRVMDIQELQIALESYHNANGGRYASNLKELSPIFISVIPKDPLDNTDYYYFSCKNGSGYHLGTDLEIGGGEPQKHMLDSNLALANDADKPVSECIGSPIKGDDLMSCSGARSDRFCYDVSQAVRFVPVPQPKPSVNSQQNQSSNSSSAVGIKITEPKAGSVWTINQQAQTVPIRWTYFCGAIDGTTYITLLKKNDPAFYKQLYVNPNKLSCQKDTEVSAVTNIIISSAEKNFADIASDSDYFIRIESYNNSIGSNVSSYSDTITIINPKVGTQTLKIVRPIMNEVLCLGTNYNISWTHPGLSVVNISLTDTSNAKVYMVGKGTFPADRNEEGAKGYGSYKWKAGDIKKFSYDGGWDESPSYTILPDGEVYSLTIGYDTTYDRVFPITIQQCNG